MSEATAEATCGNCGRTLAEDSGIPHEQRKPCPACGSLSRLHRASVSTELAIRAKVSAEVSRLRETYEHDRRWRAVGVALVVVPSVLGYYAVIPHLNGHDVTLVSESIAPLESLQAYAARMGWEFPWVSSLGSEFKYDFGAAFTEEQQRSGAEYNFEHVDQVSAQREGMSAFALQDGMVHHTYSSYARGVEQLMGTFGYLDVAPLGRNEDPQHPGAWWRRHDEYASH